jgi:hypothetical protein
MAQGEGPEFKPQYCQKTHELEESLIKSSLGFLCARSDAEIQQ